MYEAMVAKLDDQDLQELSGLGEHLIDSILADESTDVILKIIESNAPVWYQNSEGMSALHAAAYRQRPEVAKALLEQGAIWNAVDNWNNTAGEIALSLNDQKTYITIRDCGIRSELLLSLLSSKSCVQDCSSLVLQESDSTAAASTDIFLSSRLRFLKDDFDQDICMLDLGHDEIGVMMGWERGIMEITAHKLCYDHPKSCNLRVLNIGFGLGIIDGLFQSLTIRPSTHIIIEAHPDVLRHMKNTGWYDKEGVRILEGKWQDWIHSEELLRFGGFDVIYTDTFSESYDNLHSFFECLPDLVAGPESRISYFNGLGATNPLFYDVYGHICEIHLAGVDISIQWSDIDVGNSTDHHWGCSRNYFTLPLYRLPLGRLIVTDA